MTTNHKITTQDFNRIYTIGHVLGEGGFGTVYEGVRNTDNLPLAIKMVEKTRTPMATVYNQQNNHGGSENERKRDGYKKFYSSEDKPMHTKIPLEVYLMRKTSHISGVVKLITYYELPDCFLLLMERFGNSVLGCKDLFNFISDNGALKEGHANKIFKQILETVASCQIAGVLHADIKAENILIDNTNNQVKLVDFGSGYIYHEGIYTTYSG